MDRRRPGMGFVEAVDVDRFHTGILRTLDIDTVIIADVDTFLRSHTQLVAYIPVDLRIGFVDMELSGDQGIVQQIIDFN